MLKKFFISLFLIFATAIYAQASNNFLNSIILEKNLDGMKIVLRSDNITKVKKSVQSPDNIIITLNGITASSGFNAIYKNISDESNVVIENSDASSVKLYIHSPDISKADIIFETPDATPVKVGDSFASEKMLWTAISLLILLMIMKTGRNIKTGDMFYDLQQKVIREREMEMYENFRREITLQIH